VALDSLEEPSSVLCFLAFLPSPDGLALLSEVELEDDEVDSSLFAPVDSE
jgi:hypothetical protein